MCVEPLVSPRNRGVSVLVKPTKRIQLLPEIHELSDCLLDRLRHQVEGHVVHGTKWFLVDSTHGTALWCGDPALAIGDTSERELLGQVVKLVPLVVGTVLRRICYLSEGKVPTLTLFTMAPWLCLRPRCLQPLCDRPFHLH